MEHRNSSLRRLWMKDEGAKECNTSYGGRVKDQKGICGWKRASSKTAKRWTYGRKEGWGKDQDNARNSRSHSLPDQGLFHSREGCNNVTHSIITKTTFQHETSIPNPLTYLLPFSPLSLYVSFSSASSVSRACTSSKE